MDKNTTSESRKRSANFTFNEECILMCLAKKYKKILESKLTDSNSQKEKIKYWTKIECEFNTKSGEHFRNSLVLKKKYDNIKKQTKKKIVEEKRKYSCTTTGNSPSSTSGYSEIELKMKELLDIKIDGKVSEFNLNAGLIETAEIIDRTPNDVANSETEEDDVIGKNHKMNFRFENCVDDNSLEISSDEEAQKQFRGRPLATNLYTVTTNSHTNVRSKEMPGYSDSAREDETFHVESQKYQYLFEEHRLKINLMKKTHDQELRIMRQKADLELFCIREEHEIRMKILREQNNLNSTQFN